MTGPATGTVTTVAGVAAMLSFAPFGVSFETLMLGGACFFGGCCCRTGIVLYKKLDGTDIITIEFFVRQIAALLCCIPLAAVASCIVFLAARVCNIEADAAFGGLLLIMGVRGIEGFLWLTNTFADIFTKVIPGQKPSGGGP